MLQDLHRGLTALLRAELPEDIRAQIGISFATPGDDFPPASVALPALNLFLYDIVSNADLRQSGGGWEPQGQGEFLRAPDPFRIACHYIVTAWARDGVPAPEDDEFRLLGEAMRVLLRYRILPPMAVVGEFARRNYLIHVRALEGGRLGSPGEFWQALGGKPRPFFNYSLIFALPVSDPELSTAAVTDPRVDIVRKP
ncbi:DUF4255 domain-containing protein [Nannocystis sp.]|uniref:DUF4255 domain-containing protein n=1 Tax=Nannocystis sp. TaxID=1962667 RepID=UPI0024253BC4|nr:DUF4255 domain-containing protein [Nannocystis sp.]MBK7830672.1 DUF4255 domain-containing protein [Nannocystis sp.]MBK9756204.1 DUF4255 domain-containing protein [Nannocystis sp.]